MKMPARSNKRCGRRSRSLHPAVLVLLALFASLVWSTACTPDGNEGASVPTSAPLFESGGGASVVDFSGVEVVEEPESGSEDASSSAVSTATPGPSFAVRVDVAEELGEISPYVYGVSGPPPEYLEALQPTLNSWGGNPSTRYNWRLGNAWNAGSDWFYKNTDYGFGPVREGEERVDEEFVRQTQEAGAAVRLAVPTLGWVARNSDPDTCSFPLPDGECGLAGGATCRSPGQIADATTANVPSTAGGVSEWMSALKEAGLTPHFVAMDNEPELWGYTHYDVHPECTTYQEILDKYLEYATAVRKVLPGAELTGPVTCCWEFYWHSAAGSRDEQLHDNAEFIPWFLENVRTHDERTGKRTLDVLDIHYYPEGLYENEETDERTSARRLRGTRSLWDPQYVDESWIGDSVALIPRMQDAISKHYPGTKLGISEWNWGAETTMNGAIAIAEVLGILGREDVYFASYWRYPAQDSHGYFAFKMYTNYDDEGSKFLGTSVAARTSDFSRISSFAAYDSDSNTLRLMLVNKTPNQGQNVQVQLDNFTSTGPVMSYTYDESEPEQIVATSIDAQEGNLVVEVPGYSVTLLVFQGE